MYKKTTKIKAKNNWVKLPILISLLILSTACEQFVEIDPPQNELTNESLFQNDGSVAAAANGMYSQMVNTSSQNTIFNAGLEFFAGMSCDELINHSPESENMQFASNDLASINNLIVSNFWNPAFKILNSANSLIEELSPDLEGLSDVKKRSLGEAYFVRAFSHFNLTNLFGDIPYVTTTNVEINAVIGKSSRAEVFEMIKEDLLSAQALLDDNNTERTKANRSAATALLARLYLYQQDWANAELMATEVIEQSGLYLMETDLNKVFLPESSETIWQLKPNIPNRHTQQGFTFIIPFYGTIGFWTTSFSDDFLDSFEDDDLRETNWVGAVTTLSGHEHKHPFKYKLGFFDFLNTPQEYSVVLRLAEQYLIRAEARAQLGDDTGAQSDINVIRSRAGLPNTNATTIEELLMAVEQERRVELFAEWGHRWFDLIRTGRADEVLSAIPGKNWESTDVLWPIPDIELENNPNLLPQNPGYD